MNKNFLKCKYLLPSNLENRKYFIVVKNLDCYLYFVQVQDTLNDPTCNGKEYRLLLHLYSCGCALYLLILLYRIGKGTDKLCSISSCHDLFFIGRKYRPVTTPAKNKSSDQVSIKVPLIETQVYFCFACLIYFPIRFEVCVISFDETKVKIEVRIIFKGQHVPIVHGGVNNIFIN